GTVFSVHAEARAPGTSFVQQSYYGPAAAPFGRSGAPDGNDGVRAEGVCVMNPTTIRADRVRSLLRLLDEVRERIRGGEDAFSSVGECLSRLLGADVVVVVLGSQDARGGTKLR